MNEEMDAEKPSKSARKREIEALQVLAGQMACAERRGTAASGRR